MGTTPVPTDTLSAEDINTAVVNTSANTLTIVFNDDTDIGTKVLHALSGFGGTGTNVDTITVSEGFLKDVFGNASSAQVDTTVTVDMTDTTAPVVASITASTVGNATLVGVDDVVTFTAIMTDDNELKVGTSFTITLDNGASVLLERTESTGDKELVGTYTVVENDTDSNGLTIATTSAVNTASDVSGNVFESTSLSLTNSGSIAVDATLPTASIEASGHSFDTLSDKLTLSVENLTTLGVADTESVKQYLDWTKLKWNAVDDTVSSMEFKSEDISTAVVDLSNGNIEVTFSEGVDLGATELYALEGFGGTASSIDTIQASAGFLKDIAGNASSEESALTTFDVSMADTSAPTIASIIASTDGSATRLGVGDVVTFTATMTDANEIKVGSMFNVILDNGVTVDLERTAQTDANEMVGEYTVQAQSESVSLQDSSGLSIETYIIPVSNSAQDISGNKLASGASISLTNDGALIVDTTAPGFNFAFTNSENTQLTILLSEIINNDSRDLVEDALKSITGVDDVDTSYTNVLGMRFNINQTFDISSDIDITSSSISLVDMAGNNTLATTIDLL